MIPANQSVENFQYDHWSVKMCAAAKPSGVLGDGTDDLPAFVQAFAIAQAAGAVTLSGAPLAIHIPRLDVGPYLILTNSSLGLIHQQKIIGIGMPTIKYSCTGGLFTAGYCNNVEVHGLQLEGTSAISAQWGISITGNLAGTGMNTSRIYDCQFSNFGVPCLNDAYAAGVFTGNPVWAIGTTYVVGDTVTYSGAIYASLVGGNIGNQPNTHPVDWAVTTAVTYTIQITATGTPDTFEWRKNNGSWTTGVAITGAGQALTDGVSVQFLATTGHAVGGAWVISVVSNTVGPAMTASGAIQNLANVGGSAKVVIRDSFFINNGTGVQSVGPMDSMNVHDNYFSSTWGRGVDLTFMVGATRIAYNFNNNICTGGAYRTTGPGGVVLIGDEFESTGPLTNVFKAAYEFWESPQGPPIVTCIACSAVIHGDGTYGFFVDPGTNGPIFSVFFACDTTGNYNFGAAWAIGTTYASGAIVNYLGVSYSSLINGNVGNQPNTHPVDWAVNADTQYGIYNGDFSSTNRFEFNHRYEFGANLYVSPTASGVVTWPIASSQLSDSASLVRFPLASTALSDTTDIVRGAAALTTVNTVVAVSGVAGSLQIAPITFGASDVFLSRDLIVTPSVAGAQMERKGTGSGNGDYWAWINQNNTATDGSRFGETSSAYTAGGGPIPWLANSITFLAYPARLQIGSNASQAAELGAAGVVSLFTLPFYANNAAAIAGGLAVGRLYRNGGDPDLVCVVH